MHLLSVLVQAGCWERNGGEKTPDKITDLMKTPVKWRIQAFSSISDTDSGGDTTSPLEILSVKFPFSSHSSASIEPLWEHALQRFQISLLTQSPVKIPVHSIRHKEGALEEGRGQVGQHPFDPFYM